MARANHHANAKTTMKSYDFAVSIETDSRTGDVLAVYFRIRKGKAADVREFENGNVFVNYDAHGRLLGIELLAPANIKVVEQITQDQPQAQRFVETNAPRHMLVEA